MLTQKAIAIMEARDIQFETLVRYNIESVEKSDGNEWLSIPYYIGNEIVNRKFRTISGEKKFYQESNHHKVLWNFNALMDSTLTVEPLIICEGEIDALSAIEAEFSRVLSVPDGAPAEQLGDRETKKYTYLDEAMPLIRECKDVILATDNDAPGINLMNDLALRIGKSRCKWVQYPLKRGEQSRCKDLNEVLVMYGPAGIRECIKRASYVQTDGVYSMSQLPPISEPKAHIIGFPGLDQRYKIRRGDFTVVTGIPGHGKSSFLNDIAGRMAVNHNWRTAFASMEQPAKTDHNRNLTMWRSPSSPSLSETNAWIEHHFRFIVPADDDNLDLEWIKQRVEMAAIQHDCEMVIIDPWNELEHNRFADETLTEYTGRAIREFKKLARTLNIHLIVAAHPAKMKRENGQYQKPNLYDISDSAHWSNKCDIGISIYRSDMDSSETEIAVLKVRNQDVIGFPGIVKTHFLRDQRRYEWIET